MVIAKAPTNALAITIESESYQVSSIGTPIATLWLKMIIQRGHY